MAFAANRRANLYYEIHGDGDPLLLIPGLGLTTRAWAHITPRLAEKHRVIVVDPRGAGNSDTADVPYTGELFAEDMTAVLDAAEAERAHVVGLSMGGMISQELAIRYPQRVASLILLSTYAAVDDWSRRLFEVRRTIIERLGLLEHFRMSIMFVFSPAAFRAIKDRVDAIEQALRQNPPDERAYLRQVAFCLEHDAVDQLARIMAPTLVVTGSADILTSPFQGRELAGWIPGATYREFPGPSHGLWLEAAAEFVELVLSWTSDHPVTTAGAAEAPS